MKRINTKFLVIALTTLIFSCTNNSENNTFKDVRDGKIYKTVKIGNQIWMGENLAYKPDEGNYWAYDNDEGNIEVFGYLYDWETACKACPEGWHLPSTEEWDTLIGSIGGKEVAGNNLKDSSTEFWKTPNKEVTNDFNFNALPSGRYWSEGYNGLSTNTFYWTSDERFGEYGWSSGGKYDLIYRDGGAVELEDTRSKIFSGSKRKNNGLSVRCIKTIDKKSVSNSDSKIITYRDCRGGPGYYKVLIEKKEIQLTYFIRDYSNTELAVIDNGKIITDGPFKEHKYILSGDTLKVLNPEVQLYDNYCLVE